ncbi:MAG: hypothetical protein NTNFB01_37800 [Nitrospira sp.]|jgi:transposase InsO family protein
MGWGFIAILGNWDYRRGIQLDFIRPGKPVESAWIESFNGRLRDHCLNVLLVRIVGYRVGH